MSLLAQDYSVYHFSSASVKKPLCSGKLGKPYFLCSCCDLGLLLWSYAVDGFTDRLLHQDLSLLEASTTHPHLPAPSEFWMQGQCLPPINTVPLAWGMVLKETLKQYQQKNQASRGEIIWKALLLLLPSWRKVQLKGVGSSPWTPGTVQRFIKFSQLSERKRASTFCKWKNPKLTEVRCLVQCHWKAKGSLWWQLRSDCAPRPVHSRGTILITHLPDHHWETMTEPWCGFNLSGGALGPTPGRGILLPCAGAKVALPLCLALTVSRPGHNLQVATQPSVPNPSWPSGLLLVVAVVLNVVLPHSADLPELTWPGILGPVPG